MWTAVTTLESSSVELPVTELLAALAAIAILKALGNKAEDSRFEETCIVVEIK